MKKEIVNVGFVLTGIKTEQFAIFEENFSSKRETNYATEFEIKSNQENNQIGIFFKFEFIQGKKVIIKISLSCHFKIKEESFNQFINKKESKLIIPKSFLAHLAMITTGTARGVLFSKLEGSNFSRYIIPTLNVVEMITDDISFELPSDTKVNAVN